MSLRLSVHGRTPPSIAVRILHEPSRKASAGAADIEMPVRSRLLGRAEGSAIAARQSDQRRPVHHLMPAAGQEACAGRQAVHKQNVREWPRRSSALVQRLEHRPLTPAVQVQFLGADPLFHCLPGCELRALSLQSRDGVVRGELKSRIPMRGHRHCLDEGAEARLEWRYSRRLAWGCMCVSVGACDGESTSSSGARRPKACGRNEAQLRVPVPVSGRSWWGGAWREE